MPDLNCPLKPTITIGDQPTEAYAEADGENSTRRGAEPTAEDWTLLKAAVARLQEQVVELEKFTAPALGVPVEPLKHHWQHKDTGRVCECATQPSERWYSIDVATEPSKHHCFSCDDVDDGLGDALAALISWIARHTPSARRLDCRAK